MTTAEAEVRKLFEALKDRWSGGDADGYAALFSPDVAARTPTPADTGMSAEPLTSA